MKIYEKNEKVIIELDKWQSGEYTYGDGKWTVQNLIGIIAGDETYISQANYLDYKSDLQEGAPLIHFYGGKDEFRKLCKDLDIDIWEHELCAYCYFPIRGTFTMDDKGYKCDNCYYDEKNVKK